MSYCRFSSNNFMCDVYVYADVNGGWTTHVAGNRFIIPPIPEISPRWVPRMGMRISEGKVIYPSFWHQLAQWPLLQLFILSSWLHTWSLGVIPHRPIGLPHDGERYNDATPGACASRLIHLRSLGYNVPLRAIDVLIEEESEINTEEQA